MVLFMEKLNCMCFDCKLLKNGCEGTTCQAWTGCIYKEKDESKKGMMYTEKNPIWNLNDKIKVKFSRLNHITDNYIYVWPQRCIVWLFWPRYLLQQNVLLTFLLGLYERLQFRSLQT